MSDAIKRNSLFYWDTITIKVQDELFRVPKNDFAENSEVFADMFIMPSGEEQSSEGEDDEHPIFLEGYKKKDFISLLTVMYPSSRTLLSGTNTVMKVDLEKDEWISVLNLSTRWNMKKVRAYAVHQLSNSFTLSPIEKILLARAHRVAKWLEEGLITLVEGTPKEIDELSSLTSWETIARILSMTVTHISKPKPPEFRLEQLKCNSCKKALLNQVNCDYCSTSFGTVNGSLLKLNTTSISSEGTHNGYISHVLCRACNRHPWTNRTWNCSGCNIGFNVGTSYSQGMFIDFGKSDSVKEMVNKHFGDEVKEYRITWPDS